jgi:2-polyprenyl-6-methoxyphenol hydroxylase-like FAD-dependent oxidoreductase
VGTLPGQPQRSFALAGDAAHAMHPLAGQGLNVGLADVAELARVLQEREFWRPVNDLKLLRRYARARQADVQAMAWVTDQLQNLFAQPGALWSPVRNWGLNAFNQSGPVKRWATANAMR